MINRVGRGVLIPALLVLIIVAVVFVGFRVGNDEPTITGNVIYDENFASEGGITRGVICNPPYIAIEGGCCRDADGDNICDNGKVAESPRESVEVLLVSEGSEEEVIVSEDVNDNDLGFRVYSIDFNSESKELEVTYQNEMDTGAYFKGEVSVDVDSETKTYSDIEPKYIGVADFRTVIYSVGGSVEDGADVFIDTDFGFSDDDLGYNLRDDMGVEVYSEGDECDVDVKELTYDSSKDSFVILVKNYADVDCYVDAELRDVYVGEDFETLSADSTRLVRVEDERELYFDQKMYQEELDENPKIYVYVFFGEQKDKLHLEARRNLEYEVL